MRLSSSWCRVEYQEIMIHLLVYLHNARLVAAPVAVVRCGEDGHDGLVVAPVEAVHDQLMGTSDQLEVVSMIEVLRDVLAKGEACTSGRDTPAMSVIGV